jgi:outer membrane protein assembly factor BamB/tRNA A-37 threonylcarbamoyl transferase component Bud32
MSDDLLRAEQPIPTSYLSKEATTLAPGTVIQARYKIDRVVGLGGMGAVYRVRDLRFKDVAKHHALKEMIIKFADTLDQQARMRNFEHEANLLVSLNHPLIPKVYDFFTDINRAYLVLEFIQGKNLEDVLLETPGFLDERQVGEWAIQICEVLDYLHSFQPDPIIFRDLKPSNVMLTPQNQTVLIDFGIAKVFQPERRGTKIGTEGYSPPEQYTGFVEPRSDIYALGAMLHQLLTQSDPQREIPFTFHERMPRMLNPNVSAEMEMIVMKCLAYEFEHRWRSARELKSALERALGVVSITGTGQFRRVPPLPVFFPAQNGYDNNGQSNGHSSSGHISSTGTLTTPSGSLLPRGPTPSSEAAGPRYVPENKSAPLTGGTGMLNPPQPPAAAPVAQPGPGVIVPPVLPGGSPANFSVSAPSPALLWSFETEEEVRSSPALANGTIYIGSYDYNLYALEAQSGKMKWKFPTDGGICCTPACTGDLVVISSEDYYVYAISGQTGKREWSYRTGSFVRSSPRIVQDMIVVGSDDKQVHAMDLRTGRRHWKFDTWREVRSTAVQYQGIIYIGSDDERVYAIEAASGREKWKFLTRHKVTASPAISDGLVFIGSMDGHLYALDMNMGWLAWKFPTNNFILATPALSEGRVYIGSVDQHFYCLDIKTGRQLWNYQTGGQITSSAAIINGHVYFGCADGAVYCLEARTGQVRWKFQTGGPVPSSPLVRDGVLYIGSNDHRVYALSCTL